jgi:hypothetical protein
MNKRHELSWNDDTLRGKWMLFLLERKSCANVYSTSNDTRSLSVARMKLASTYYSIAMSSFSKLLLLMKSFDIVTMLTSPGWIALGTYCFLRSLPNARKSWELKPDGRSHDDHDVYSTILLAWGKYEEAMNIASIPIRAENKKNGSVRPHTLGLLYVTLVHARNKYFGETDPNEEMEPIDETYYAFYLQLAIDCASEAIKEGEVNQAIRILRKVRKLTRDSNMDTHCAVTIHRLLKESEAKDQKLKAQI